MLAKELSLKSMIFGSTNQEPTFAQKLTAIQDAAITKRVAMLNIEKPHIKEYILNKCQKTASSGSSDRYVCIDVNELYGAENSLSSNFTYYNNNSDLPTEEEVTKILEELRVELSGEKYCLIAYWRDDCKESSMLISWE